MIEKQLHRLLNVPALIERSRLDQLQILGSSEHQAETPKPLAALLDRDSGWRPYTVTNGVAVIPVSGSLIHKLGFMSYYATGYDVLETILDIADNDDQVQGILLDIDSGGGEVAGCFDLVDFISNLETPVWSIANEFAASAAYAIASAADRVIVTRTAQVGSVGVVMRHIDISGALEQYGEKVTLIYAGDHKVDGNPYEPLDDDVRERFQAEINDLFDVFANTVATNRKISVNDVVSLQAAMFTGSDALEAGLADDVMSFRDALESFINELSSSDGASVGGVTMDHENNGSLNAEQLEENEILADDESPEVADDVTETDENQETETETETDVDESEAENEQEQESGADAVSDRERIAMILNHESAQGREATAKKLALETDLTVEQAVSILESTEKSADSTGSRFLSEMDEAGGAGVPVETEASSGKITKLEKWRQSMKKSGGLKDV